MHSGTSSRALLQHLLVLSACLAAAHAQAETSPYYIGGSVGATHVSNVYRTTQGQPTNNDTVTSATLLAGLDQQLGRQRLFADASLGHNTYKNNSDLSNSSYSLNAGLDWQTMERLSGSISLGSNRSLAQFNPGDAPSLKKKNMVQLDSVGTTVRYGLISLLSLEGSFSHHRRDYTAEEFAQNEFSQDASSLGLVYRPSAALRLGIAGRHTKGKYPKYQLGTDGYVSNEFSRNDVDLTANWTASSASSVNARLSSGKSKYTTSAKDFSGLTGAVSWRWAPSAKLQFNTSFSRDSGTETSFISLGSLGNLNYDNSRITTMFQIGADYALDSKLIFNAKVSVAKRDLSNSSGTSTVDGNDRTTNWALGGRWLATRSSQLGCQITREERTGQSSLSQPYTYSSYGCYAQLTLQ